MKLTKKMAAIAACACMAATSMVGISASAATINDSKTASNFSNYSYSFGSGYTNNSRLYAQSSAGTISSANSYYDSSYKSIIVNIYKSDNNGSYVCQDTNSSVGYTSAVSCPCPTSNSLTVRRQYVGNFASGVDNYNVTIKKY